VILFFLAVLKQLQTKKKTKLRNKLFLILKTAFGQTKLQAEQYILVKPWPQGKRVFIFRPSMIHGPGNKGNLNLLYQLVSKGFPRPLGTFSYQRSFCSIDNVCFVISQIIEREDIPSGVYNLADDETLSTNDVISVLAESQNMYSPRL
jgi:nucleoside-diphosphate-sugar epimerase